MNEPMRMENERENFNAGFAMQHRRIILSDGRYLIFYTFAAENRRKTSVENSNVPGAASETGERKEKDV